jgi:hypothetical protein
LQCKSKSPSFPSFRALTHCFKVFNEDNDPEPRGEKMHKLYPLEEEQHTIGEPTKGETKRIEELVPIKEENPWPREEPIPQNPSYDGALSDLALCEQLDVGRRGKITGMGR